MVKDLKPAFIKLKRISLTTEQKEYCRKIKSASKYSSYFQSEIEIVEEKRKTPYEIQFSKKSTQNKSLRGRSEHDAVDFARKNIPFDNGHVNVSSFTVNYEEYDGFEDRGELSFPNLPPNQWYMVDLFPGFNFNLRGSAYRSDTVTPLGPNKVLMEFNVE